VVAAPFGAAVDWTHPDTTVLDKSVGENETRATIENQFGERFTVSYRRDELTEERIQQIVDTVNRFYDWEHVDIRSVRFLVSPDFTEVNVIPEEMMFQGTNILPHVPAGLTFFLEEGELRYDFRMRQADFFMSLEGRYLTEVELLEQMVRAIDEPSAYVRRTDPTYYMSKFDQIDQNLEEDQQQIRELSGQLDELGNRLEEMTARAEEALAAEQERNQEIRNELEEQLAAARDRIEELETRLARLRFASVLDESRKFFGLDGVRADLEQETVQEIVRRKQENPEVTVSELEEALAQDGTEVNDSVIEAVFRIYFNEIPE
jgi:uncharacterized protein YukE